MKLSHLVLFLGVAIAPALIGPVHAQGVVKGAEEGAAVGNKAAGPVGGVVGGAVGGVTGGVVGGVKGVLGVPQNTSTSRARTVRGSSDMSQAAVKADIVGRPLQWSNADGTQKSTTVFYADGTASMKDSNLPTGADDEGKWSFKGKQLCVTWEKFRAGEEHCSTWVRTGPKAYRDSEGMVVTTR